MKKTIILTLIFFMTNIALNAQDNNIYLWPDTVPGEKALKHPPVVQENKGDNVTRLTDINDPFLKVFEPTKEKNNHTSVIICPGGGYNILAIDKEGYEIADWFSSLGYTSFVLHYRVPQKPEEAFMDLQKSFQLIKDLSGKYNTDPDRIGIIGFSAGGHLAAKACTYASNNKNNLTNNVDPLFTILIYPAYLDKGEGMSLSPELRHDITCPVFIFSTNDDKHGHSGIVFAGSLWESGSNVEFHLFPRGGHGYGLRKGNAAAELWPELLKDWLSRYFGLDNPEMLLDH
jgi:acetyl esterase/lipase